jgi:hypothetical protein
MRKKSKRKKNKIKNILNEKNLKKMKLIIGILEAFCYMLIVSL